MRLLTYNDFVEDSTQWVQRVTPLNEDNLEAAGIDLTVGGKGCNVTSGEEVSFETGDTLEVRPGDFVNIQTAEVISLEPTDLGLVFAKVSLTQRGFTSFGSKIDPGFRGRLLLSFANNGHTVERLSPGQRICMVSILVLDEAVDKRYVSSFVSAPPSRPVVIVDRRKGSALGLFQVVPDDSRKPSHVDRMLRCGQKHHRGDAL